MKIKNKKLGAFVLCILFVFATSCSVYQKQTSSIDEAVEFGGKVKIVAVDGRRVVYNRLEKEDNDLHGIIRKSKVELNEERIREIHIKDRSKSTLVSIAVPIVVVGIGIALVANSVNNMSFGSGW